MLLTIVPQCPVMVGCIKRWLIRIGCVQYCLNMLSVARYASLWPPVPVVLASEQC